LETITTALYVAQATEENALDIHRGGVLQFLKTCNDFFETTTGMEMSRQEEELRSQQERAQTRFEDVATDLCKQRQVEAELQDRIADLQLQIQITESKSRGNIL
jgi:hypothetical protein